jgi:hypothetical protein
MLKIAGQRDSHLRERSSRLICCSACIEFFCGGLAGVGGAAQETGDGLKFAVLIAGADMRYFGVHPGREAEHLRAPAGYRLEEDDAAVGRRGALTRDPAAAFISRDLARG